MANVGLVTGPSTPSARAHQGGLARPEVAPQHHDVPGPEQGCKTSPKGLGGVGAIAGELRCHQKRPSWSASGAAPVSGACLVAGRPAGGWGGAMRAGNRAKSSCRLPSIARV